jgi:hypothetical protein
MKARELLDIAAFGPDALKVIGQAFDGAWASIAGNFDESPRTVEAARMALANAVLAEARANGHNDVEKLKNAALRTMARAFRKRYERGA